MNKREKEKKTWLPGVIAMAFLASLFTFLLLLSVEKNALSAYEKVNVWSTNCEMVKGLEITEKGIADCLVQIEVEKTKIPSKLVEDTSVLIGQQTKITIPAGTILTESMFTGEENYREGLYNPVIAGCKGDDLFQMVSGVLRKGDRVNIYTVNRDLEETYMLWENIVVYEAFDAAGKVIAPEDISTPAARVNLLLEEGYTQQFYSELNKGSLRLVKIWE